MSFPAHCPAPKVPESEKPQLPPLTGGWGLQATGWGVFPAVPTFLHTQPEVVSVPAPELRLSLWLLLAGASSAAPILDQAELSLERSLANLPWWQRARCAFKY